MSNTFIKAKGGNIGDSVYESDKIDIAKKLIKKITDSGVKLHLPEDCLVSTNIKKKSKTKIYNSKKIEEKWINVDIGPKTIKNWNQIIMESKKIIWNGPLGIYEIKEFSNGTNSIALSISNSTKNGAHSLVGGGDSIAALNNQRLNNDISFVSTGGGALLSYITNQSLISIEGFYLKN